MRVRVVSCLNEPLILMDRQRRSRHSLPFNANIITQRIGVLARLLPKIDQMTERLSGGGVSQLQPSSDLICRRLRSRCHSRTVISAPIRGSSGYHRFYS